MNLEHGESKGFPDHPHRDFESVTYKMGNLNIEIHMETRANFDPAAYSE
jgi:redox-sensitive bicupin YhaK (pirin superfamily)